MKDKDLKNSKPNGGIRPSPLKVHNRLLANILRSSSLSNGTNSLHESARVTYLTHHHNFVPDKTIYRDE